MPCLENANFGNCAHQDNACLCASEPFVSSTTACIESACSGSDLTNAEQYSQDICKSVVRIFRFAVHLWHGADNGSIGCDTHKFGNSYCYVTIIGIGYWLFLLFRFRVSTLTIALNPVPKLIPVLHSAASSPSTGAALSTTANAVAGAAALGLGVFVLAL